LLFDRTNAMKKLEAVVNMQDGPMDGGGERAEPGQVRRLGRTIVDVVPAIVEALLASRSSRVHRDAMVLLERPLLAHVLSLTRGNQLHAARLLGLNRNTLRKRCRDLDIVTDRASTARRRPPASCA
jgi:two-component system nitrogen regulation response regulator GlnG